MPEADAPQTLWMILPRLVGDERVRSALAERFGSRVDDVIRRVKAGEVLHEQDRDALTETVEEVLSEHGEIEITYPDDVNPDGFYGEDNLIVNVMGFAGFYWVDAPEFDSDGVYFDKLEDADHHAEEQYGFMFELEKDDEAEAGSVASHEGDEGGTASADDRGRNVVEELHGSWQIGADQSVWMDDADGTGFDWRPGDFRVRVRASKPQGGVGAERSLKLSVRTDLLKGVEVSGTEMLTTLSAMNGTAPSYAFICHEGGEVVLQSTAYLHGRDTDWLPLFFAGQAILQPIAAQSQSHADAAGQLLGGSPDRSRSGAADAILDVARDVYAPGGAGPSRWDGTGEFEAIAAAHGRSDTAFGFGGPDGLTLETAFGDETALLQLTAGQRHPSLGAGLLSLLRLPVAIGEDGAERANALNAAEADSWTGVPLLGAWSITDGGLVHGAFVPNALYRRGIAETMSLWALARARWARRVLLPDEEDRPLHEILSERSP